LITRPLNVIIIDTEERHLVQLLRAGDQGALKSIFMRFHRDLCRVAFRILRDEDKSKDVVQEVFLKLWIKRADLDIKTSLAAYLRKAVVNTSINSLHETRSLVTGDISKLPEAIMSVTQSDAHSYKELSAIAEKAIQSLPARTRAVFQLIRLEGMSYREAAEHLEISEKAVEKEMMKALRMLREMLKDYLAVLLFLKIFLD
jgi:RNA polymerase sigma-70 factor, ECF subfamily